MSEQQQQQNASCNVIFDSLRSYYEDISILYKIFCNSVIKLIINCEKIKNQLKKEKWKRTLIDGNERVARITLFIEVFFAYFSAAAAAAFTYSPTTPSHLQPPLHFLPIPNRMFKDYFQVPLPHLQPEEYSGCAHRPEVSDFREGDLKTKLLRYLKCFSSFLLLANSYRQTDMPK